MNKVKKTSKSFGKYIKDLDHFGEPLTFKFDGGKDMYRTALGGAFTLAMISFVLWYISIKAIAMAQGDSVVTREMKEDYFDATTMLHEITPVAFGISDFPRSESFEENWDYGKVKFYIESWNETDLE